MEEDPATGCGQKRQLEQSMQLWGRNSTQRKCWAFPGEVECEEFVQGVVFSRGTSS